MLLLQTNPPEHALPQLPQFCALIWVFVSHPFEGLLSQLPKPVLHIGTQLVPLHDVVPLRAVHAFPQVPQFCKVFRGVSHPVKGLPSQSPKPLLQATSMQLPLPHDSVAFARSQALPQAPQCVSVFRSVSQPLFGLLSQSSKPSVQAGAQAPALHIVVPCWFVHMTAQAPQFWFVLSGASHPVAGLLSQSSKPLTQPSSWQVPVPHDTTPFGRLHAVLHAPQLISVLSGVSQPVIMSLSQLSNPVVQLAIWHIPPEQTSTALGKLHSIPQPLQ
jgi:hypothetical protein